MKSSELLVSTLPQVQTPYQGLFHSIFHGRKRTRLWMISKKNGSIHKRDRWTKDSSRIHSSRYKIKLGCFMHTCSCSTSEYSGLFMIYFTGGFSTILCNCIAILYEINFAKLSCTHDSKRTGFVSTKRDKWGLSGCIRNAKWKSYFWIIM